MAINIFANHFLHQYYKNTEKKQKLKNKVRDLKKLSNDHDQD